MGGSEQEIAETFFNSHFLQFGGYNGKLFGIMFKIKVVPVDVTIEY